FRSLIAALTQVLRELDADDSVTVVVLAGAGKSFSAGADLNWMRRMADYGREENLADAEALAAITATLNGLDKPTIARVQGAAFGGRVGLMACSALAIAADAAIFCL